MKKLLFLATCIAVLMLPSCKNPKDSEEYKRLEAERDSLKFAGIKQANEYNEIMGLINEIEDKFREIKEMENYLTEQSRSGAELNRTTKDKILSDMQLLTDNLKKNKEQIQSLQQKLKASGLKSVELEKRITSLFQEIENKVQAIVTLQDELEKKKILAQVEDIYDIFTRRVAAGRDLPIEKVLEIGEGRVWSGTEAIKLGLINQLGTIDDAIAKAAELAELTEFGIMLYPIKQDFFTRLFSSNSDNEIKIERALQQQLGDLYFTYKGIKTVTEAKGIQAKLPFELIITD